MNARFNWNLTMCFINNNLGDIYFVCRQFDKAKIEYEKRVRMRPYDALNAFVHLGTIAYYHNDATEAKNLFSQALSVWDAARESQLQTPAGLFEYKAVALLCLGRTAEALQAMGEVKRNWGRGDTVDFDIYVLLEESPDPPRGLQDVIAILKQIERDQ